jgi:hypothetical protein
MLDLPRPPAILVHLKTHSLIDFSTIADVKAQKANGLIDGRVITAMYTVYSLLLYDKIIMHILYCA